VAAVVARMDGLLPEGPVGPVTPSPADRRALALRMLRVAGSPGTDLVLRAVASEAVRTGVLAELLGQGRVEFWETLADLVQVGLVEHEPERGTVRATAAGRAVLDLVDRCAGVEEAP
jgi:DNA-binding GntR family transcriptional regulator